MHRVHLLEPNSHFFELPKVLALPLLANLTYLHLDDVKTTIKVALPALQTLLLAGMHVPSVAQPLVDLNLTPSLRTFGMHNVTPPLDLDVWEHCPNSLRHVLLSINRPLDLGISLPAIMNSTETLTSFTLRYPIVPKLIHHREEKLRSWCEENGTGVHVERYTAEQTQFFVEEWEWNLPRPGSANEQGNVGGEA